MPNIESAEEIKKKAQKYGKKVEYHAHRLHKLTKATKDQKDFSTGYTTFHVLMDTQEFTNKEKNEFLTDFFNKVKDKNNPEYAKAKGFLASMYDFKKIIPKGATIWGAIKKNK